ncbi:MAG: SMP-30/gluconolactonase/LRE family protein [Pseudomonadales bacterium]|nr:SMP-30/gluconolactonase/LRE family protein [Pseudomonadales bacterium]
MKLTTLVDNLCFSEGPRWHDGRLFYSDFNRHVVEAVSLRQGTVNKGAKVEVIAEVPNQPSGLGWLPDGRLLIVSMIDQKILRQERDGRLVVHADLSSIATYHCNDMVVDAKGRAYVGNFGFNIDEKDAEPQAANLAFVDIDGSVSCAAEDLMFPNGSVITPDGKTLIIGESYGRRLSAFDINEAGQLSNRRVWADIKPHLPDGICLDEAGGIWVADPVKNCVIRVEEGGQITQTIKTGRPAFACMLGGENRNHLFICTATGSGPQAEINRDGRIEYLTVDIPGAGLP